MNIHETSWFYSCVYVHFLTTRTIFSIYCLSWGLNRNLNNSILTNAMQKKEVASSLSVTLGRASCSVRRRRCWWWHWQQLSCRHRSPAHPGPWLACTANCIYRKTTSEHESKVGRKRKTSTHLNWGVLRSTLRFRMCFPVQFTISSSTAFFSSSSPRPCRADMDSAPGSESW